MWTRLTMGFESFWKAGLAAALFSCIFYASSGMFGVPVDLMICIVAALVFWVTLTLLGRRAVIGGAHRNLQNTIDQFVSSPASPPRGLAIRDIRTAFFRDRANLATSAGLVGGVDLQRGSHLAKAVQDLLDDASDDVAAWYGPVNALVWSIPAVGFVGMAWHLRALTAPLGHVAGKSGQSISTLVGAPMVSALLVVSSALLAAVVGYMQTALAMRAELRVIRVLRDALSFVWTLDQSETEDRDEQDQISSAAS